MSKLLKNLPFVLWCILSSSIVIGVVLYIFLYIFIKGAPAVTIDFILASPKGMPLGVEGGIFPAIVGSLALMLLACTNASVLGLSTAIYICLYCANERVKGTIHLVVSLISGIPSIVIGLFGYSFLVYFCGFGVSLISGGITLGIMIFPYIEIITERAILKVDKNLITSSYALGVDKCYTFFYIIIPQCKDEIVSGIILSGSFAIGAAAPVMLTSAVVSAPIPDSLLSPVMALPYHLYNLVSQGVSFQNAYATSLILILILILLNLSAVFLVKRG